MSRILLITESWPPVGDAGRLRPAAALRATGREIRIITNGQTSNGITPDSLATGVTRLPVESLRTGGLLFGLRNALFFGSAANPGNYALLRDRLHMHLQEVLYDAVLILCPPEIYLRLGNWIHETFGIPVWLHLSEAPAPGHGWNYRRLRRKYLAAAQLITADSASVIRDIDPHEDQAALVAAGPADNLTFTDPATGAAYSAETLLQRIIRKKQHS